MKPSRFTKKPVEIEAVQLFSHNRDAVSRWVNGGRSGGGPDMSDLDAWYYQSNGDSELYISTPEGVMTADEGDWIIRDVKGEFYPCKPDIFFLTYSPVAAP